MPLPTNLSCGASGWTSEDWDGVVYPRHKPRRFHALEYLSGMFDALEIGSTFRRPLRPEISRLWIQKVAANPRFQFTAKLQHRFTHERDLPARAVADFKDGLWPLLRARKLGALLLQFPWTFRYTEENRSFLIQLRRTFPEFPLVAEMRHASWMRSEALGTLMDYHVGFCNIDQAPYTKGMPPTSLLTSDIGYVRLHGRNDNDWNHEFHRAAAGSPQKRDYLYSAEELLEWQSRIEEVREHSTRTFVIANNGVLGKGVVNALQLAAILGDGRREAPGSLIAAYPGELADFTAGAPVQQDLFRMERVAA